MLRVYTLKGADFKTFQRIKCTLIGFHGCFNTGYKSQAEAELKRALHFYHAKAFNPEAFARHLGTVSFLTCLAVLHFVINILPFYFSPVDSEMLR